MCKIIIENPNIDVSIRNKVFLWNTNGIYCKYYWCKTFLIYKTPLDLATLSGDQDLVNAIQEKMKNITVPYEEKIREERRKIKEKKIQEKLEKEKEVKQNEDLAMDELFS